MMFRVVQSTDAGYVAVSKDFDDLKDCVSALLMFADASGEYFAVQEMPSGAVTLDYMALASAREVQP